jgi:hypothetical protein
MLQRLGAAPRRNPGKVDADNSDNGMLNVPLLIAGSAAVGLDPLSLNATCSGFLLRHERTT